MRCRAVLSSCSCSPGARLFERPKNNPPSPPSSSPAFPLHFRLPRYPRVITFPFPQPRRSLIPNRCRVTTLGARGNYHRLRYSSPRDGVCVRQMSCKKFSLGAKDTLHAPCFRVYRIERGTNEDTLSLNYVAE